MIVGADLKLSMKLAFEAIFAIAREVVPLADFGVEVELGLVEGVVLLFSD